MASSQDKDERFLAEIFKVAYKGKDVDPHKQFGTIIIRNRKYHHYIYDVDDTYKCKLIKDDDELTLTGPTQSSISCPSGYLVLDVDLFCGTFKETILVTWQPYYLYIPCHYGSRTIKSKYDENDEISIHFGMFYRATEAFLEFSLFTTDDSDIKFSGSVVAARIKDEDADDTDKEELSESEEDEAADTDQEKPPRQSTLLFPNTEVESGEPVRLSRSLVAVPLKHELLVKINLSNDDESFKIVDDLKFYAELDGTEEKTSNGTNCNICAKVTWNANYHIRGDLNDICDYE